MDQHILVHYITHEGELIDAPKPFLRFIRYFLILSCALLASPDHLRDTPLPMSRRRQFLVHFLFRILLFGALAMSGYMLDYPGHVRFVSLATVFLLVVGLSCSGLSLNLRTDRPAGTAIVMLVTFLGSLAGYALSSELALRTGSFIFITAIILIGSFAEFAPAVYSGTGWGRLAARWQPEPGNLTPTQALDWFARRGHRASILSASIVFLVLAWDLAATWLPKTIAYLGIHGAIDPHLLGLGALFGIYSMQACALMRLRDHSVFARPVSAARLSQQFRFRYIHQVLLFYLFTGLLAIEYLVAGWLGLLSGVDQVSLYVYAFSLLFGPAVIGTVFIAYSRARTPPGWRSGLIFSIIWAGLLNGHDSSGFMGFFLIIYLINFLFWANSLQDVFGGTALPIGDTFREASRLAPYFGTTLLLHYWTLPNEGLLLIFSTVLTLPGALLPLIAVPRLLEFYRHAE
ncbi:MAG: hypothetical protein HYV27_07150 [Candidatus Hydrogenedentes bacterium]|nr:hypothetical protein [Candidatus Hydrogenedentota bacterium]